MTERVPEPRLQRQRQRQGDRREGQGGEDLNDDEIPEFVGSDVVTRNTRVISQNPIEILTDTNARQWDDGWVMLADGYQF